MGRNVQWAERPVIPYSHNSNVLSNVLPWLINDVDMYGFNR